MKKNIWLIVMLLLSGFILGGCASPRDVKTGMTSAEKAVSIPGMIEIKNKGETHIFTFPVIINSGVNGVEGQQYCSQSENSQICIDIGVYPLAILGKDGFSYQVGFYFVTELNEFGDKMAQAIVIGKKSEVKKIVFSSRDGYMFADSMGNRLNFDSDKFYGDSKYQKDFMDQVGESPAEIENVLQRYYRDRGVEIKEGFEFVEEIEVGSSRWNEFVGQVTDRMGKGYRLDNGEVRQGYVSLEEYQKDFAKNEGATSGQRFSKSIGLTYTGEPVSSAALTLTSLLNGLIQSNTGITEGLYSEAPCKRKDLAERFEFLKKENERLLKYLHYRLAKAEEKIIQLGGTP